MTTTRLHVIGVRGAKSAYRSGDGTCRGWATVAHALRAKLGDGWTVYRCWIDDASFAPPVSPGGLSISPRFRLASLVRYIIGSTGAPNAGNGLERWQ